MNKIDGVDSNYKFIVATESTEDKYIQWNYERRDRNEHLTFLSFVVWLSVVRGQLLAT